MEIMNERNPRAVFWTTFWLAYIYKLGLIGRADETGVKAYNGGSIRLKLLRWDEIESCEVTRIHDAMGRLGSTIFVFKNRRNSTSLQMLVLATPAEQIAQFEALVENHLSAPEA